MARTWKVGDIAVVRCTFRDLDGDVADPTAVTLDVQFPDADADTYSYPAAITRVSTGVYQKSVTLTTAGVVLFEWQAGGDVVAVASMSISVAAQVI